jgi:hypothetical protein
VPKESEYRGWLIRATSYQNAQGRWIPRAEILAHDARGMLQRSVSSTQDSATQAEADARALLLAQKWIDTHPSGE